MARRVRLEELYKVWQGRVAGALSFANSRRQAQRRTGAISNHLVRGFRQLELDTVEDAKVRHFVPFAQALIDLEEARIKMVPLDSERTAIELTALIKTISETRTALEKEHDADKHIADQAAQLTAKASRDLGTVVQVLRRIRSDVHVVGRGALQRGQQEP